LEHALYPKKVLLEFKRILKKDGILKLVLPYPDQGPIDAHVAKIELGTNRLDKGKFFTEYLSNLGFKILNLITIGKMKFGLLPQKNRIYLQ